MHTTARNRAVDRLRRDRTFAARAHLLGTAHDEDEPMPASAIPDERLEHGELARLTGSPVVELNRAVAVAEVEGAEAALRIVDGLGLDGYRYLHSTRGELLRRLGRADEAANAYRRALDLAADGAERRFLEGRIGECGAPPAAT